MGIFGQSTPFDADIEKATSETNTNENWSLILDVCDKVLSNPRSAKDCLKAVMKRMGHADPHIVMQAITLLDACSNNCGKAFHLEVASREFENEFRRLLVKAQPKVSLKMRQVLKSWAEGDYKSDLELNLIPSLYSKLRQEGFDFSNLNDKPKSAVKVAVSKDPNVVSSQQEEDDIAKAIELSLKETKNSPKHASGGASGGTTTTSSAYSTLYPSFSGSGSMASITSTGGVSNNSATSQPEPRKVRALYDFEAAEENELTFFAGEIIHVLDDSDPNWWKGFNQRGDGLFPSNFVTADLSVDPERLDINQQNKSKKSVQFEDDAKELQQKTEAAAAAAAEQRVEIDEAKIDRLLHLLHEANPEDPSQDTEEMLRLEQEVHQMGPLIDAELERVDRKHAQLTQLSSDLVDAINLYHSLMRDDRAAMINLAGMPQAGGLPGMGYQGIPNPQMLYGAAGYPGGGGPPLQQPQMPWPPMSYGNTGQLPTSAATATPTATTLNTAGPLATSMVVAGAYPPNSHMAHQLGSTSQPASMAIPMQFQNGHVNAAGQMNGATAASAGVSALPPHMNAMPYGASAGQMATTNAPTTHNSPMPTAAPGVGYPAQNTQIPMGGPQMPLPISHNQFQNGHVNAPQMTDGGMHALPLEHQQHSQHHYASIPNVPQHQQHQQSQAFMTTAVPLGVGAVPGGLMQHPSIAAPPQAMQNPNGDQFNQLQQQMAALAMGGTGIHQPVPQAYPLQNEQKNNIPIYQQR